FREQTIYSLTDDISSFLFRLCGSSKHSFLDPIPHKPFPVSVKATSFAFLNDWSRSCCIGCESERAVLSLDTLKIDQSFVRQITAVPDQIGIVSAIIDMGKNLRLNVVAEGVETNEELGFLQSRYCDEAQGYYFSRPVPPTSSSGCSMERTHGTNR